MTMQQTFAGSPDSAVDLGSVPSVDMGLTPQEAHDHILDSLIFANDTTSVEVNMSSTPLPPDMTFSDAAMLSVVSYSVLFVVAAIGNLTVFITLFRNRKRKSRVNLFILHLAIADLIVTFIMLPLETTWNITVAWYAGGAACRILMFFRAFGLYLSSFILVVISLDRYFAILHPMSLTDADRRGRIMIMLAWAFSFIASIPQSVIFHVEQHPQYPWFEQCVTFNFFPTQAHELVYNLFNIVTVYGIPLVVILASYTRILLKISSKAREGKEGNSTSRQQEMHLRRSGVGRMEKARAKTLKMTLVIVIVFITCWTPYYFISLWWWFDKESAKQVDPKVERGLFLFAVSNSCVNPIVYGIFALNLKREFARCCPCMKKTNAKLTASRAPISIVQRTHLPEHSRNTDNRPLMRNNGAQTWATDVRKKHTMMDLKPMNDDRLVAKPYGYTETHHDDDAHNSLLTHR